MATAESKGLTATQVETYRPNGYVTVENIITEEELTDIRAAVDELVEGSWTVTSSESIGVISGLMVSLY